MTSLSETFRGFSGIDSLLDCFVPRTPYGQAFKRSQQLCTDRAELESIYDKTEAAISLVENSGSRMDKIRYHLKKIERLPDLEYAPFEASDVFLVKKFLFNYKALTMLICNREAGVFCLKFDSHDLGELLGKGGGDDDSFIISEAYSLELQSIRKSIAILDDRRKAMRDEMNARLLAGFGLDFRFREFILLETSQATGLDTSQLFVEPNDEYHVVVRPVYCDEYFKNMAMREALVVRERQCERSVLDRITSAVIAEKQQLRAYEEALCDFDVSLARAEAALKLGLRRPRLDDGGFLLKVVAARHLPLERECENRGEMYTPLTIDSAECVVVIRGSNMCGKTVVLKTVAFLQAAAQMGFFVPAAEFASSVYSDLTVIRGDGDRAGLGSFGNEVVAISSVMGRENTRPFVLLDEPARTTNSREAVALISGIIEHSIKKHTGKLFVVTHYDAIPKYEGACYFRMKGLNRDAFQTLTDDAGFDDRIKMIHKAVAYEPVFDSGNECGNDALFVAGVLGLDGEILKFAEEYLYLHNNSEVKR